jgi:23S rRNA (cytosine1962-C5)-methyltransferase
MASGTPVLLRARDRTPLAVGYWDARAPIAVRLLGDDPATSLPELVRTRLVAALDLRLRRIDRQRTNAFRWVHGEADRLPGLHVDLYADVAAVRYDGEGARAFYRGLPETLLEVGRPLGLRGVVDRDRRGEGPTGELEVREDGLRFGVDLERGQKGGLFLDQRENRIEVASRARDRTVLNLFGYTGGFSIHAGAAGAASTDTVDLARPALEAARRNFARNDLPADRHRVHAGDAFAFLERAAAEGKSWDIVISDPPSFVHRKDDLSAGRAAYRRLHALAAAVVTNGGLLCPASCSSHIDRKAFLATVDEGVRAAGRSFTLETIRGAGFDHPVATWFPEGDYLKFAIGRVGEGKMIGR